MPSDEHCQRLSRGTRPSTTSCGRLDSEMPRPARLDAPNTLHHVRVRGRERRVIFTDDTDREDFVAQRRRAVENPAAVLGVRPQTAYQAVARGRAPQAEWDPLLGDCLVILGNGSPIEQPGISPERSRSLSSIRAGVGDSCA